MSRGQMSFGSQFHFIILRRVEVKRGRWEGKGYLRAKTGLFSVETIKHLWQNFSEALVSKNDLSLNKH